MELIISGRTVLIDDEDYERVSKYKWYFNRQDRPTHGYVKTTIPGHITIFLHKFIMGNPSMVVDHINQDTLDNRKCNLRICTPCENMFNKSKYKNNTSGYKGVFVDKRWPSRWRAKIGYKGKRISLGSYNTPEEAYQAYRKAAIELYGEYARV